MICEICKLNFENINKYHKHLRRHKLLSGNFKCNFSNCSKSFPSYSTYIIHYYRKHKIDSNICELSSTQDNSFSCEICNLKLSERRKLVSHICQHMRICGTAKCPFCPKHFRNENSFKSHVARSHTIKKNINPMESIQTPQNEIIENNPCVEPNTEVINSTETNSTNFSLSNSLNILAFKLKYVHYLPETTLQIITSYFSEIISNTQNEINKTFEERLRQNISNELFSELSSEINSILKTNDRNTTYTRLQNSLNSNDYIPPKTINLGLDNDHAECSFQYIPICDTIPKLINNMPQLENISCKRNLNTSYQYSDFYDGVNYRNNSFFQSDCRLEIILYMDSFNVAQPLGAAKSKYKIAAIYYTLGNIPRPQRFKLENMQLALLCLESNIKKFGIENILKKLVDDLIKIEIEGIDIKFNSSEIRNIKGSLVFIIADNLGSHQIGGFTENFSTSKYFCRTCKINLDDFSESHRNRAEIRNNESYIFDGNNIDGETFGIKHISIFNNLNYFKICQPGLPPCIAHDLYEGIIAKDLNMYIQYFVSQNWFSFYTLNRRFKQIQKKLKLSTTFPLLNSKSKKLTGGAVQNYTFLTIFPLIISYLSKSSEIINYENRVWKQVTRLLEICQIVSSYSIHFNQLSQLDYLIQEYLDERKYLFPNQNFLRKHHFIQHYSYYIRQFGPLMGYATLRFESKHQFFKRYIQATKNFINVTLSLSVHHQMYQVAIQSAKQNPLVVPNHIQKLSPQELENSKCEFKTENIIYNEITYKKNLFVVIGRNIFGNILSLKIKDIFFDENFSIIIINGLIHKIDYDYLNGSYIIHPTESAFHINITDLVCPIPFSTCIINNEIRTSLKYSVPLFY